LRITLQTGVIPQEAGAFVSAVRPSAARTFPSKVTARSHASLKEDLRELTAAQRLDAFVEQNQLASELREMGRAAQAPPLPHVSLGR